MGIKLLYGTHRRALLDNCLSRIARQTRNWPNRRAFLVVPETVKADTERRYIENFDPGGLMMAEVLSFRRLAYRLFSEAGGLAVDYLSSAGRSMLIQSLIRQHRKDFNKFAGFADKPGYAAEIDSVLGDFRRYDYQYDDLINAAERLEEPALAGKLKDFALLARLYDERIKSEDFYDRELDLDRLDQLLRSKPDRLSFLEQTSVWICGFGETRDFTAQEYRIIDALSNYSADITITVCSDLIPASYDLAVNGQLEFQHGRLTGRRLADRYQTTIEHINSDRSPVFAMLADWLLSDQCCSPEKLSEHVKLIRAADKAQELAWVAGEIRRLVSDEGFRYKDIAIAACDLPAYQYMLQNAFREFNLPGFIDIRQPLLGTALLRFISNLISLCRKGERFENLMTILRTDLLGFDDSLIDQFENFCLAYNLIKHNRYKHERFYPQEAAGSDEAISFLHQSIEPLLGFCRELSAKATVNGRCELIINYLSGGSGVMERVQSKTSEWIGLGEQQAALALVQAWNYLVEVLGEMSLVFADQKMNIDSFSSVLSAAFTGAVSRVIPIGTDRIMTGSIAQIYSYDAKVLFVVGASRDTFPSGPRNEGILRNHERETLEKISGKALPDSGRFKVAEDAFGIYSLLTMPSERLYLSCPDLLSAPSSSQQRLFALINQETVLKKEIIADVRLNSQKRALLTADFTGSQPAVPDDPELLALKQALQEFIMAKQPAMKDRYISDPLDPALAARLKIDPEQVMSRYPDQLVMSVSRVQKFNECPFAHYAAYLLGLQERTVARPDSRLKGTLLHTIAERAFSDLTSRIAGIEPDSQTDVKGCYEDWRSNLNMCYIDRLYNDAVKDSQLPLYSDPGIYSSVGRRLRRLALASIRAASTQLQPEGYMPFAQEWSFPSQRSRPLVFEVNKRRLIFRGVIDRVDLHADLRSCRIIDYKSGRLKIDYDAVYQGLQLQLPAYLHAWLMNNPDKRVRSMGYFRFGSPHFTASDSLKAYSEQELAFLTGKYDWDDLEEGDEERLSLLGEFAFAKVRQSVMKIFSGDVSAAPRCLTSDQPACQWCEFKAICRYDSRTLKQNTKYLDRIKLPAEYPGIDEMKKTQKKQETIEYILSLMRIAKDKSDQRLSADLIGSVEDTAGGQNELDK